MNNFTNQYSLSKTLRFELKPVGSNGQRLSEVESNIFFENILKQDRKITSAYDAVKPLLDGIHEEVINSSLTSIEAKQIDFLNYFEEYQKGKEKKLSLIEKKLREAIGQTFFNEANNLAHNTGNDLKGKPIFKKKKGKDIGAEYLTQAGILKYIEDKIKKLVSPENIQEFIAETEGINAKGKKAIARTGHLATLGSFFTYFGGYNQNRENYYDTDEKSTAVATRIVHENLPKFCDNIALFEKRKSEYLEALTYLKENNKITQIKDAITNTMIEAIAIDEAFFNIQKFSWCLSQDEIENYNTTIGHYNYLINLYDQAKRGFSDFRKLPKFKILYKQIGCGKKKSFIDELKYNTIKEQINANLKSEEVLSLEGVLKLYSEAGEKYFSTTNESSIYYFMKFLKTRENWDGIYWSKAAVDKVSNKYLNNWYEIKDKLKGNKACVSFDKKREEQIKINDAVELSGLFSVIDAEKKEGWSESFFKNTILEEHNNIIDSNLLPSQNLINLICNDIKNLAIEFDAKITEVLKIKDYQNEDTILQIKECLDTSKHILWIIKYFMVKENKVKGNAIDSDLSNLLTDFLHNDKAKWFIWYDLIRNYLTKKTQDAAKDNKLKLNFKNPTLLGGWSDGQEKNKGAVLLKNNTKQYVGLLMDRAIFDTEKEGNQIYTNSNPNTGRLILRNLKFQTLAGKGFVGKYGESYGVIGKESPLEAVEKLQLFIKENYVNKYPLLKEISEKKFKEKKDFDKEIQEVLLECYECNFAPINWEQVLEKVAEEKMYLFEIYSKDFSENKGAKSQNSNVNLQTKYWEQIFNDESNIQLNGGGEIFYREKVELKESDKAIHKANVPINRRSDNKKESIFKHDIIKNKRFTENKFFFHVPIKINYQAPTKVNINSLVNDNFTKTTKIQFLGIDRGEKHLISYSLLNDKGEMIEQNHFDIINKKDYLTAINEAAKKRKEKQENWQQKDGIANLKEGYISLVVHEIVKKMKDKDGNFIPTFIVLEDLNIGFKRGRQKFEQQVYQKFELALAKKLNFLVDKNAKDGEIGSVSNALQFTPPIANYKDIENRKQVGIMLYTRANYTSVTDPATGWRKSIYLKKGSENEIKKEILENFTDIGIDINGDYYFEYQDKNTAKKWKLWASINGKSLCRYRAKRGNDKNEYVVEIYDVKDYLDKLFKNFDKKESLKLQIENGIALQKVNDNTAWESLRFVIDIIQQIRNSDGKVASENDNFLQSPVRNDAGIQFDSRDYLKIDNSNMPKDADANGAFNIARKGIIMFEHIKSNPNNNLNLFISDAEWDLWHADKDDWNKKLATFCIRNNK